MPTTDEKNSDKMRDSIFLQPISICLARPPPRQRRRKTIEYHFTDIHSYNQGNYRPGADVKYCLVKKNSTRYFENLNMEVGSGRETGRECCVAEAGKRKI